MMKICEIMENASASATASGAVATVAAPMGGIITRNGGNFFSGKYTNDPFPNTPKRMKQNKGKKK
jgi:hypothetical protein